MRTLETLTIRNFKSIREQTLKLGPLNVFIGGNGAGKSNLIGVFRFLREIINQRLAEYTARRGGADAILHFGRSASDELEIALAFGEDNVSNGYKIILAGTDDDELIIKKEYAYYHERPKYPKPYEVAVASYTMESKLQASSELAAKQVAKDLDSYRVYHFHDTSETATVKATSDIDDNRFLRPQAENLPAFLYWMQEKRRDHFDLITDTVRQVAPFFGGFRLAPSRLNESKIRLEWAEKGSETYFNASALSDGTLRFICLATLLLQPDLPAVVLLDEPELGLHPAAITILAGMLASASTRTQVIVATQSVTLVNQFEPDKIWTVDRLDNESVFRHLDEADIAGWLDDYALGELWEKNLLGARP
jgi:predicted ATPase